MSYKTISANDAQELLQLWQARREMPIEEFEYPQGDGDSAVNDAIASLKRLHEQSASRSDWAAFDGEAAVAFHQAVAPLPPSIEGNPGFWRWVALQLFNVIEWRHARPEGAHPHNYGLGSRMSNYPIRLWLRAALSYDDQSTDPYELTRRGAVDFWESGIIRPRYSSCRPLVRSFVRYQYPELSSRGTLHLTHSNGIRSLYKRLKRLHATMALELLNDDDAHSLVDELGSGLQRA